MVIRRYMSLRSSKILIRLVLILITFQFLSSAFLSTAQDSGASGTHKAFLPQIQKSISPSLFIEKTEEEREGERDKLVSFELIDFNFSATIFAEIHTPQFTFVDHEEQFDAHPPLFKLHCVYIIWLSFLIKTSTGLTHTTIKKWS